MSDGKVASADRLIAFGPVCLVSDGVKVPIRAKKVAALLVVLGMSRRPLARGYVAELLWEEGGLRNLRQALYVLRGLPGAERWLEVTSDFLSVSLDCAARTCLEGGAAPTEEEGSFAEGLEDVGAMGFREWLDERRAALALRVEPALENLSVNAFISVEDPLAQVREQLAWLRELEPLALAPRVLAETLGVDLVQLAAAAAQPHTAGPLDPLVGAALALRLAEVLAEAGELRLAARHFEAVGEKRRAGEAWLFVGRSEADTEALLAAERLLDSPAAAQEVLGVHQEILRQRRDFTGAAGVLARHEALAQRCQMPEVLAEVCLERLQLALSLQHRTAAEGAVAELKTMSDHEVGLLPRLRFAEGLMALVGRRDGQAAVPLLEAAVAGTLPPRREVMALNALGAAFATSGEPSRAVALHQRGLALARRLGDVPQVARLLNGLGHSAERVGETAQAIRRYAEAAELFGRVGEREHEALVRHNLALMYRRAGRWGESRKETMQALELASSSRVRALLMGERAELERRLGRFSEAAHWLERATVEYEAEPHRVGGLRFNLALSRYLGCEGSLEQLWEAFEAMPLEALEVRNEAAQELAFVEREPAAMRRALAQVQGPLGIEGCLAEQRALRLERADAPLSAAVREASTSDDPLCVLALLMIAEADGQPAVAAEAEAVALRVSEGLHAGQRESWLGRVAMWRASPWLELLGEPDEDGELGEV